MLTRALPKATTTSVLFVNETVQNKVFFIKAHAMNLTGWSKLIFPIANLFIFSQTSLTQPMKLVTWETRVFKMPRLGPPRFKMGTSITVSFGLLHLLIITYRIHVPKVGRPLI